MRNTKILFYGPISSGDLNHKLAQGNLHSALRDQQQLPKLLHGILGDDSLTNKLLSVLSFLLLENKRGISHSICLTKLINIVLVENKQSGSFSSKVLVMRTKQYKKFMSLLQSKKRRTTLRGSLFWAKIFIGITIPFVFDRTTVYQNSKCSCVPREKPANHIKVE